MARRKNSSLPAAKLQAYIEQIEAIEVDIAALNEMRREVYGTARDEGFDTRTMRKMVKERKLEPAERRQREALRQIYRGALGMLDGTPLGDAAIAALTRKPAPDPAQDPAAPADDAAAMPEDAAPPAEPLPPPAEARAQGEAAAKDGKPVTDNPFPPATPQRAAFDEGWCHAAGSDGMDIPDAWRRPKKEEPKKEEGRKPGARKPDAGDDAGDDAGKGGGKGRGNG